MLAVDIMMILLAICDCLNSSPATERKMSRPHDLNIPEMKCGYPAAIETFNRRSSDSFFSPSVFFHMSYIPRRVRPVRCFAYVSRVSTLTYVSPFAILICAINCSRVASVSHFDSSTLHSIGRKPVTSSPARISFVSSWLL